MKYILVRIKLGNGQNWIVAEPAANEGEYKPITPRLHESIARRLYDELRLCGMERLPTSLKEFLL